MNFDETEDLLLMRKSIYELASRFGDDYWNDKDRKREFPHEYWDGLAKYGWFGINIPENYGGAGLGMYEAAAAMYEVSRAGGGVPAGDLLMRTLIFAAQMIQAFGSEPVKERYLPKLAKGEVLCSFAHTEPNAGVNTFEIETFAEERAGEYYLRGQKIWITLAHMADIMIVVARTTPKDKVVRKSDGLTLFLIEAKGNGVRTSLIPSMALRCLGSCVVYFEDVRVPADNIIGEKDKGWGCLTALLNAERISTASIATGTGELVLSKAVEYSKNRVIFGRPIGSNQAIQFPLALCKAELDAAKLMAQKAAWLYSRGRDCAYEANVAALLSARAAYAAADRAVQTLGGMGFAEEYAVERLWRDLRLFKTAPVPEEMVLSFIGTRALGMPRTF